MDFAFPADHRVKFKESEKRDKYLNLSRELKNYGTWRWLILIVIGVLGTISKELVKGLENLKNERMSRDHPDYYIIKISQNTEKSLGDLLSLKFLWKTIC